MTAITPCHQQVIDSAPAVIKRVSFRELESMQVETFESMNIVLAKELFYQAQDYAQFRADFQLLQAEKQRLQRIERLNQMAEQVRHELLVQKASRVTESGLSVGQELFRPSIPYTRGCARMA
jgi:hypothetical protein